MDAYDLQARHAPAAFALLPLVLVAAVLVPGFADKQFQAGSVAAIVLLAVGFVATRIARSAGRAKEKVLFAAWGGKPSTAMLRFQDPRVNRQTKSVYRERLTRLGAAFPIPTEQEEERDPAGSEVKIEAALDEVRRRAKERAIKAVHRENINYGAARNVYGLKLFGIGMCVLAGGALVLTIWLRGHWTPSASEIAVAMGLFAILAVWLFASTADGVRHHAEAYALALFESIETLV